MPSMRNVPGHLQCLSLSGECSRPPASSPSRRSGSRGFQNPFRVGAVGDQIHPIPLIFRKRRPFYGQCNPSVSLADAFTRSLHTFVFSSVSLKISTSIWLTATPPPFGRYGSTTHRQRSRRDVEDNAVAVTSRLPAGEIVIFAAAARSHAAAQQIIILYIIRLIAC